MTNFSLINSIVMLVIMIGALSALFYFLKGIEKNNVFLYLIILGYWVGLTLLRTTLNGPIKETLAIESWQWGLVTAGFFLVQSLFRYPLVKLAQKLKSKKTSVLLAASISIGLMIPAVATNFAVWAVVLGSLGSGVFIGILGMKNQYFSDKWDSNRAFLTATMIFTIPSISSYIADITLYTFSELNDGQADMIFAYQLVFIVVIAFMVLWALSHFFSSEIDKTIYDNNMTGEDEKVTPMTKRNVIILIGISAFCGFAYYAVNSIGLSRMGLALDAESALKAGDISGLLTTASTATSFLIGLWLIRYIRSYHLTLIGHGAITLAIIVGTIGMFTNQDSLAIWLVFAFLSGVGFSAYQTTLFGVISHFDRKNAILVLAIWLTSRSTAYGFGTLVGSQVNAHLGDEAVKYLFLSSMFISIGSLAYLIYFRWLKTFAVFDMVDKYIYYKDTPNYDSPWEGWHKTNSSSNKAN